MFLRKSVLKICSKFTGEHTNQGLISIKMLCNFVEITLQHGCSPVNLLHICKTPVPKNTPGQLLLNIINQKRGIIVLRPNNAFSLFCSLLTNSLLELVFNTA